MTGTAPGSARLWGRFRILAGLALVLAGGAGPKGR